jgi:hypothetical protein
MTRPWALMGYWMAAGLLSNFPHWLIVLVRRGAVENGVESVLFPKEGNLDLATLSAQTCPPRPDRQ